MKKLGSGSAGLTVLLGAITALTPAAMDIYLVSMASLTEALGTDLLHVQLTVVIYLIGNAIGQIGFGSLSDRFGRRPVLLSGLALFVLASAACASAQSIEMLIVARLLQGIGICAGLVVGRAIVRDCYSRERAAQVLSLMAMLTGLAPLVAPMIGSQLHAAFGWRANFTFLALAGGAVFVAVLFLLEETLAEPDGEATRPSRVARHFAEMLSDRRFASNAVVACAVSGGLIAFLASASFIFVRSFGFDESYFGLLFGLTMVGNILGALVASRLVARLGIERTTAFGTACAMAAGVAMTLLMLAGVKHPLATIVPIMAFLFAFAIVLPQATAAAMAPFAAHAGAASSLLGSLALVFSAIVGGVVGACFDGTPLPLALGLATMGILSFVAFQLLVRRSVPDA